MILPDVLEEGLYVVFCGTAVSTVSREKQAYYAGPGNRFWPTLHETGLTDSLIRPQNYRLILRSRLGLTDLCKRASGPDSILGRDDFDAHALRRKVRDYAPVVVAFNGKKAAREVFGRYVDPGRQDEGLEGALVWVLPSTAGTARGTWDQDHWQDLADFVQRLKQR